MFHKTSRFFSKKNQQSYIFHIIGTNLINFYPLINSGQCCSCKQLKLTIKREKKSFTKKNILIKNKQLINLKLPLKYFLDVNKLQTQHDFKWVVLRKGEVKKKLIS